MPRGSNPNSRKALEENRQKTQFRGESAVKAAKKSNQVQRYNASFRAAGREKLTDDELNEMWAAMIEKAKSGSVSAFKTLFDVMGEGSAQDISESTDNRIILVERLDDLDE